MPEQQEEELTDFEYFADVVGLTEEQIQKSVLFMGGSDLYIPKVLKSERLKKRGEVIKLLLQRTEYIEIHLKTGVSERQIRRIEWNLKNKTEEKRHVQNH